MSQQPEALRLADILAEQLFAERTGNNYGKEAAAELRRLYEENAQLLEALARLVGCIDHGSSDPSSTLDVARAAIAAAKGEA